MEIAFVKHDYTSIGLVDEAMKSPKHSAGSVVLFDQSKVGPAALKKASSSLIVAILSHKPVHKGELSVCIPFMLFVLIAPVYPNYMKIYGTGLSVLILCKR
ncbi:hypothetical protein DPMN_070667 [Dreissena polymorpha]|uniref:Uncharacterized protein n=1 Tax=Dreissena polymorpha TaxID=45954 RepID=A0A9D4BP44_DREPO|nr:hypothetical protein DPMN_070667 [Dreissena polymorpha]